MENLKIEFGELYILNSASDYWIVNAQRRMKFTDGNPVVVKLEHSFRDQFFFFGHLQDGGGEVEVEFGIDDIVEKYDKEKEKIKDLTFLLYDIHRDIQDLQ